MQRNQFGALCIECSHDVGKNGGFIFDPGGRTMVVCDQCIYLVCGQHIGVLRTGTPPSTGYPIAGSELFDLTGDEPEV